MSDQVTKNFRRSEFACRRGCGKDNINPELVELLQTMRDFIEREHGKAIPFRITSGVRCPTCNAEVGGSKRSAHLDSDAADIAVTDAVSRYWVLLAAYRCGAKRVGVAKTFIHVDVSQQLPSEVTWVYP